MSRIAERLGFTTMALYRHVHSKDELVALMADEGLGPPRAPEEAPRDGWRSGLELWAWDLLAVVRRHRWALELDLARLPFGPNRAAWLDGGLRALAETALAEDEKAGLVLLVNDYVFSYARRTIEEAAGAAVVQRPLLPDTLDDERFPALRRALAAGILSRSGRDRDDDFAFGLERILDGIDRLVSERPGGGRK